MRILLPISMIILFLFLGDKIFSQQPGFNLVLSSDRNYGERSYYGTITDIQQDPRGYIWLSTAFKGLQRYDGVNVLSYSNDPRDPNSLSNNRVPCFHIDSSGIIWAATYGGGLDKFDPEKNRFIHFRHDAKDASSISNDTVFAVLRDHLGVLWIGTYGGLDMFNEKTGRFTHFRNIPGDPSSLSYNRIWYMYEDRQGTLWVGCGSPFLTIGEKPEDGGLNRFDRTTGKFIRYLHDPKDPNSITNNKVRAIFEDSKGNFWVGGAEDELHIMDRTTGKFTRYNYDPAHPDKLSGPPLRFHETFFMDHITFIREDAKGSVWIGSSMNGINRYDPVTKKITHFSPNGFRSFSSHDGLMWFSTAEGDLYNIDPSKTMIPYSALKQPANSIYYEDNKNVLWIGSIGLIRKDLNTQMNKVWVHDPLNKNSLCNDTITGMKGDGKANLWIATLKGLCKFDLHKEIFTAYQHDDKNTGSISANKLFALFIDHNKNIWTSAGNWIVEKLNPETGIFTHYKYNSNPNNLINDYASCFAEDQNGDMWIGTRGLIRLGQESGKLYNYLPTSVITNIYVDGNGIIWAGAEDGLFQYDRAHDRFIPFIDPNTTSEIQGIINILEDKNRNLWISTSHALVKINSKRDEVRTYGASYGVHNNTLIRTDNYKAENGELFLGDQGGYYAFNPGELSTDSTGPVINFTSFKIGDRQINTEKNGVLNESLWKVKEIKLKYNQNNFSFAFFATDYKSRSEKKYFFMLENYDNNWHYTGSDARAYLFKVPPGNYLFRVKAVNGEGNWSEKSIKIIIAPPWWRTWWAYTIFALLFITAVWGFIYYRSHQLRRENRLLEQKVAIRTNQLQLEKEKVEHTLIELKSTQAQLIQKEKMASLGELTAGIAHEIQNPLNFVNNFSEVNNELIEELQSERTKVKGERNETLENEIINDVKQNLEKINLHGKRADAIVKNMLQHSRSSGDTKELTDINRLADEYLRLSYHGLRAKDKSFNSDFKTDFDESIGKINVIPQDIGRVLLNLFNNAFYVVNEKLMAQSSQLAADYKPLVSVQTKKINNEVQIRVCDNGNGIPQKIMDKIFQPFFTTKPTGQGTGLGLSLAYDIIKTHGGEIKVQTKEGEGSEFIIQLPTN
jgi:signal transduction histidine kinase/ligand-binding sensor domain-containing protein